MQMVEDRTSVVADAADGGDEVGGAGRRSLEQQFQAELHNAAATARGDHSAIWIGRAAIAPVGNTGVRIA